jgi:hypothetical protein
VSGASSSRTGISPPRGCIRRLRCTTLPDRSASGTVSGQLQTGSTTEPAAVDGTCPSLEQAGHASGHLEVSARWRIVNPRCDLVGLAIEPIEIHPHRPVQRPRRNRRRGAPRLVYRLVPPPLHACMQPATGGSGLTTTNRIARLFESRDGGAGGRVMSHYSTPNSCGNCGRTMTPSGTCTSLCDRPGLGPRGWGR